MGMLFGNKYGGWRCMIDSKTFLWRVAPDQVLPTKAILARLHEGIEQECSICGCEVESLIHIFKDCQGSRVLAFTSK